jgi:NAD dependent epimerase/dehydratase family enzyme
MILSPDSGGVFDVFLGLVRRGFGGTALPGNQYVSWIHDVDFIRTIEFLIERQDIVGAVNLASPNPLPNREFMHILRQAWGTRIGLPSAEWMLEIGTFLLRTESELVLKSRQVVPGRLLDAGFRFHYPGWTEASRELVSRWKRQVEKEC